MQSLRALIVLPTYQEAENIAEVLRRVRAAAPRADVLVIDDSSPDGTADIARAMDLELGGVSVFCRPAKLGLGSAYREGFRLGRELGYEALLEMDSDLSHEPTDIPRLLRSLDAGADLVIGSRYVPGGSIPDWPWHRRALSSYGNHYAAFMLRLRVRDATAGFRAYRPTSSAESTSARSGQRGTGSRSRCAQHQIPATDAGRICDVQSRAASAASSSHVTTRR
jgi:dolichol-phosphate mannosyltransferase